MSSSMECAKAENLKNCTCTYESCSRRGACCACVMYHRRNGEIPGCFFSPEAERTYDRSVRNFVATQRWEGTALRFGDLGVWSRDH